VPKEIYLKWLVKMQGKKEEDTLHFFHHSVVVEVIASIFIIDGKLLFSSFGNYRPIDHPKNTLKTKISSFNLKQI
jgi:hypothetical protein